MASGVLSCNHVEVPPSISFSGSGFMATYQLGVAQCLLNYVPSIVRAAPFVLGASAGSLVAAAVVCDMSPITIRDEMIHFAKQMKAFRLGPFNPSINVFHWLECILNKYLPSDAHRLASGRLAVAMTRLSDGKHIVTTEFQSKEDVVQYYLDGGFTGMQPVLPVSCSHTLTVSPFSGETDICPSDTPCMWDMVVSGATLKGNMANSVRVINALYPMALETLEQAYYSGYKDTIDFLLRSELVPRLTIHKISQGQLNANQTTARIHLETTMEEEEEIKAEKEKATLTAFEDIRNMPMGNNDPEQRLELVFRQAPELVFWAWHSMRHFFFFFFKILVGSLKKNTKDRVMPIIMFMKWLKILAQFEALRGQRPTATRNKSSDHSENDKHRYLLRQFITPSRDKKKPKTH
ncbi:putative patatin-like phospholipase domain-containing protein 3 [Scophthalmus maximus]|uniref:Putative patatin-like phospholipase domain-containing protein 3 n=1 Tax=Scophthalmus maximus TaxID=52904 RepID=A0A2U9C257_SCOMX|nr:putative patatin-like phospholipase domain-containing protein 3 [Scophthalmus maximus]